MTGSEPILVVPSPARVPFLLRPALWLARRLAGKDPLPARLLARFSQGRRREAGLSAPELEGLLNLERARWEGLAPRERLAARYAEVLSRPPVDLDDALVASLRAHFSE